MLNTEKLYSVSMDAVTEHWNFASYKTYGEAYQHLKNIHDSIKTRVNQTQEGVLEDFEKSWRKFHKCSDLKYGDTILKCTRWQENDSYYKITLTDCYTIKL